MRVRQNTVLLSIGWWSTLLLLGPLLWAQGRWARLRTPRLPPPPEPLHGECGDGARTFRLVMLGESPAAGIGVAAKDESLPAQLAQVLAQRLSRRVVWRSLAVNGANLRAVIEEQLPQLPAAQPDLVVVVLGVNDTTGLTPRTRWRLRLQQLVKAIRTASRARILFTSVPRMDSFTALPQPLRSALGWRARLLDIDLQITVGNMPGVSCTPPLPPLTPAQLSADGYHPSALACRDWAAQLAGHLQPTGEDLR